MTQSSNIHFLFYQSEILSRYSKQWIHGFTGKPLSYGGPDTPGNPRAQVLENRTMFQRELGHPEGPPAIPNQVHGHRIGRTGDQQFQETDGILLTRPNHPVMLLFADCVPVIVADPLGHAAVVLHAGWRGTRQAMAQEGVTALTNFTGTSPEHLVAAIGPAIGLCCYQVSRDIAEALAQTLGWSLDQLETEGLLAWDDGFPDNPRVNLKGMNRQQLIMAGVRQIDVLPQCTHCETDRLFSYRRGEDGRNSAWMMLLDN